jgi:hypothetical protein
VSIHSRSAPECSRIIGGVNGDRTRDLVIVQAQVGGRSIHLQQFRKFSPASAFPRGLRLLRPPYRIETRLLCGEPSGNLLCNKVEACPKNVFSQHNSDVKMQPQSRRTYRSRQSAPYQKRKGHPGRVEGRRIRKPVRKCSLNFLSFEGRHHIPRGHRVIAKPVLGGLHHEYGLEKIAA